MKVEIDNNCTACGLCVETCPEVFKLEAGSDTAEVVVNEVPTDAEDSCRDAVEGCPVEAIHIVEQ